LTGNILPDPAGAASCREGRRGGGWRSDWTTSSSLAGPELAATCRAVHFSEGVEREGEGARLSFDYRLRPGVATSRNALKLLELVGLGSRGRRTGSGL